MGAATRARSLTRLLRRPSGNSPRVGIRDPVLNGAFLLTEAAVDLGKQRIFAGLAADAQIVAVRFREPGALETFPGAPLEVIDGGKIAEGRDIIHEELEGFAAPLDAPVEFSIGIDEVSGSQISSAKLEATDPRVQQVVSVC